MLIVANKPFMLSVVKLNVIMGNVMAPTKCDQSHEKLLLQFVDEPVAFFVSFQFKMFRINSQNIFPTVSTRQRHDSNLQSSDYESSVLPMCSLDTT